MTAVRRVSKGCFGKRPHVTASCIIAWMPGLAAMSAPRCAGGRNVTPGLACAERRLLRALLRESREEPLKISLPNLVVDFSSSFFLQDCVAMHPEGVVDAADAKAFAKERKFCLRILAQLNTFVHCSNNILPWLRADPR